MAVKRSPTDSGGSSLAPEGVTGIEPNPKMMMPNQHNPPPPLAAQGRIFVTPKITKTRPRTNSTIAAIRFIGRPPLWGRRSRVAPTRTRHLKVVLRLSEYAACAGQVSSPEGLIHRFIESMNR